MICETVEELTSIVGTRPACRAVGASVATVYRRRRPPEPRAPKPRPRPERALSEAERERVLALLHSERFVDCSPAQVWATLLDEDQYLCSERTMYRLLAASLGGVRERRDQLTHPTYTRPELLAERPNEVWSWDISKLKGPAKWTCFHLYVILDVFSRYCVGWTVQQRESAELARALIGQAVEQQRIEPGRLTVHADRGTAMRSKPVAFLLADLGVLQDAQPALHLERQPLQRSAVQDAQVPPRVPRPIRLDHGRALVLPNVLRVVQPRPPPLRDRPDDPGHRPPRTRPRTPCEAPARPRGRLRRHARTVRPPAAYAAGTAHHRLDQQARHQGGCSLIATTKRLTGLDRLRPTTSGATRLTWHVCSNTSTRRSFRRRSHLQETFPRARAAQRHGPRNGCVPAARVVPGPGEENGCVC